MFLLVLFQIMINHYVGRQDSVECNKCHIMVCPSNECRQAARARGERDRELWAGYIMTLSIGIVYYTVLYYDILYYTMI